MNKCSVKNNIKKETKLTSLECELCVKALIEIISEKEKLVKKSVTKLEE